MNLRRRQRGISLILIAVAMLALIAIAGLALDVSHLVLDQARLQSTLDATAVSAAKVLDNTGSTAQATAAALYTFGANAANDRELARAGVTPTVEFSSTAVPFNDGSLPPQFVRVSGAGFGVDATLSSVLGFRRFSLQARSVAGPSPTLSNAGNLTPLMMCGTAATPAFPVYGYQVGQVIALQLSSGTPLPSWPGNYLTLSSGVYSEDQDFAGAYATVSSVGNSDATLTGTVPIAVATGLDTRFDEYVAGDVTSAGYPPDVIITQPAGTDRLQCAPTGCAAAPQNGLGVTITNASQIPNYNYEGMYLPRVQAGSYDIPPAPAGIGVVNRRVLAVPVGDCTVSNPGGGNIPVIGFACVFTLQDVDHSGGVNTGQVFGEVLQSCQVNGTPAATPNNAPGPYSIQLYHVAGSPQS